MGDENEEVLLDRDGVKVTTKRAVIHGTTYPIASLSAVRVDKVPAKIGCFMIVGFFTLIFGISAISGGVGMSSGAGLIILGSLSLIVFVAMAVASWLTNGSYIVRIHTAGLQSDALSASKPDLPNAVCEALNEAIIKRG